MAIRAVISALFAVAALLLVALAPTVAAAHGGVPHAHAAEHVSDSSMAKDAAVRQPTELRAQPPASQDGPAATKCDGRGCCSAGHCSGCGTVLAPGGWTCLYLPSELLLLSPDTTRPASLAREGPPRPPKSPA
jgi:hypothetical protein